MMFKLSVNTTKEEGRDVRRIPNVFHGCDVVDVVSGYVYLGITMNYNDKFEKQ